MIDTGAVYVRLLTAFCPETRAVVQVIGQPRTKPSIATAAPDHRGALR